MGDAVTTDDVMPAGAKVLPFRSNIPRISEFVFSNLDEGFARKALATKERGGGIIVGGENYGQGSSREHAAIAPMYLGIQAVIAKSFARIHRSNLINFGILPLIFRDHHDSDRLERGDILVIGGLRESLEKHQVYSIENRTKGFTFQVVSNLNEREKEIIRRGGLLPFVKERAGHEN